MTSQLSLDELRGRIDSVDQRILTLLQERADLVIKVGEYKRERGIPVYDPHRERFLLDRVRNAAEPPLDADAVQRIFERMVDEMRRIEQRHIG